MINRIQNDTHAVLELAFPFSKFHSAFHSFYLLSFLTSFFLSFLFYRTVSARQYKSGQKSRCHKGLNPVPHEYKNPWTALNNPYQLLVARQSQGLPDAFDERIKQTVSIPFYITCMSALGQGLAAFPLPPSEMSVRNFVKGHRKNIDIFK
jgi:hypothetical protein